MNNELKLEYYLSQLDRALWALPVGQRSEIITEIKSHIREALERDTTRTMETVLADMGSAQDVANKYLSDRGVQVAPKGGVGPWFKYLAYGFLGFFGFVVASVFLLVWYFSPIIKIDSKTNRVELLGGMIDIKDENARFKIGNIDIGDLDKEDGDNYWRGSEEMKGRNVRQINIPFNTAKIDVTSNNNTTLSWDCKSSSKKNKKPEITAGIMTLDLEILNFAKCDLQIPPGVELFIKGVNGKVTIFEPQNAMTLDLVNGKVGISPDSDKEYNFDINVKNGLADTFEKSLNPKAIKMKVSVVNGLVDNDND